MRFPHSHYISFFTSYYKKVHYLMLASRPKKESINSYIYVKLKFICTFN